MDQLQEHALLIIRTAVEAVKPRRLLSLAVRLDKDTLVIGEDRFDLSRVGRILVVGAGKASAHMAEALEEIVGQRIADGVVIVKDGYAVPSSRIRVFEAGHPILDQRTVEASKQLIGLVQSAGDQDLVIGLWSGGGSTLLESIPQGLSLKDLQATSAALLKSGMSIQEANVVRRHLSLVKGGQLLRFIAPAKSVNLVLSDVVGDPLECVSSGPTATDPSTFADAREVIRRHELEALIPASVRSYLEDGRKGNWPETLKPGDLLLRNVANLVVGNNRIALKAAERKARELGYGTMIVTETLQGESREVARAVASIVKEVQRNDIPVAKPACILLGGETTVSVRGDGMGGRNQELVLAALIEMEGEEGEFLVASCGTDGTDGMTDAAGGWVTSRTLREASALGLDAIRFLDRNDSYHFLDKVEGLIRMGPTGTNVMDLVLALIP